MTTTTEESLLPEVQAPVDFFDGIVPANRNTSTEWWRGAAIYQIYPRSFQDTNGDGIGDLRGITVRLPYIAALGVDAVWISPFFKSPMRDFGYDISDYCDVDPMFGTLADFDALIAEAHRLGLKVLIDLVLSHTAAEHPWFVESRQDRTNPKADWYVWADPQPDGTPPNNWLSLFGGSAWHWDTHRGQYYMRNFLTSQPDLNYHCPEVQQAALDVVRFWMDRGVDGFRFDVVNFYFHDKLLRNNPPQSGGRFAAAVPRSNPYAFQRHLYDKTQPENLEFLQRLRKLMDSRPGITSVGEIGDDEQYATLNRYTTDGRLHMAYTFNLMERDCSPRFIHGVLEEFLREAGEAWVCWALNNHDVTRVVSRWQAIGGPAHEVAPLLLALLGSLRGSICLYQGEELGLTEAQVPFELIQDPYGKVMWPAFPGRDGCRTPIPWHSGKAHGGFTETQPWLPVPQEHLERAVDRQMRLSGSVLRRYQSFLRWRRMVPPLCTGGMRLLAAHDQVVAFERFVGDERVLCAFNLSGREARYDIGIAADLRPMEGHGFDGVWDRAEVVLPPYQAYFGRLVPLALDESAGDS